MLGKVNGCPSNGITRGIINDKRDIYSLLKVNCMLSKIRFLVENNFAGHGLKGNGSRGVSQSSRIVFCH